MDVKSRRWADAASTLFNCTVRNKLFSALEFVDEDLNIDWAALKKMCQETCDEVLHRRVSQKRDLSSKVWQLNGDVRKSPSKDKKEFINALATEAEIAAGQRNIKKFLLISLYL